MWLFGAYLGQKRTYKERCKIDFFMVKMRCNRLKNICSWTIFGNSVFLMLHGFNMSKDMVYHFEKYNFISSSWSLWGTSGARALRTLFNMAT
ncbi:hypothetical protein BY93_21715 [Escherichia coli O157:H7 str. K6590]|uniref:Uncharacterized protein n=2 Tax=Traversvirus TaxID=1981157 RepID=Q7Y2P9_9CAUD|nr:hypothetical protein Stx1_p083 [Escherichia Stx1 converting phage]NP_859327.1 hypothetical protein Stx2II_p082 [Escherichia phage Stx2 II]EYV81307.1 hypothetical protein BY91_13475 [Escherichia coli O157:H7 str. K5806]EYX70574.1 hypothetical protein BY08_11560 [Escherichia coli O103:H2 str. 2011C-3750]EZD10343.1 hypothetical protein BY93_21715 [Escherichia coli O157:H7 str. K6590]PEI21580.1 hypothetical protein CRM84_00165 [Escherichia coli]BAB87928.1 hypothetical protein [Stx2 converting 